MSSNHDMAGLTPPWPMSHDPGRCQVDARAAWKTAFGDQPRWQHDVTTAIEGLAGLLADSARGGPLVVDEDAAHRTSSCLRLSALIADADRRNVFVKKLALATMFPDGSVDKEYWHKTMSAWACFGGFRGAQQHPAKPFLPDLQ